MIVELMRLATSSLAVFSLPPDSSWHAPQKLIQML
jgi:hypothetical protein